MPRIILNTHNLATRCDLLGSPPTITSICVRRALIRKKLSLHILWLNLCFMETSDGHSSGCLFHPINPISSISYNSSIIHYSRGLLYYFPRKLIMPQNVLNFSISFGQLPYQHLPFISSFSNLPSHSFIQTHSHYVDLINK